MTVDSLLEKGRIPDFLLRVGIRRLLRQRLREERAGDVETRCRRFSDLLAQLDASPIAIHTDAANQQHYEAPTAFFQKTLGKRLKYSCGYWRPGTASLDQAEEDMLAITAERAGVKDGESILELGCGWGSLTLYLAERFPNCRITAVSNSRTQKRHIDGEAKRLGLANVEIVTADINEFAIDRRFDRVVSVEMFEHMRNYRKLMGKIAGFLEPGGQLFVHIFSHREYAYPYEARDDSDWMAKYFFTGGMMPSDHLLFYFCDDFAPRGHWRVSGVHYQKTAEAWLRNMDRAKAEITPLFESAYPAGEARKWWNYWRLFFMACAELWGYRNGEEWLVSHYLFEKRR